MEEEGLSIKTIAKGIVGLIAFLVLLIGMCRWIMKKRQDEGEVIDLSLINRTESEQANPN